MARQFVNELNVNQKIEMCFMLSKKEMKRTKHDKPYLQITLSDKSGKVEGRLWDDAERFNAMAETGDVVLINGSVEKFREEKQIKIESLRKASDDEFDHGDMVRVVENRDEIFAKVAGLLGSAKNDWIKKLVNAYISDDGLMSEFTLGAGAKSWHNAYIGGLLEHTFEVMTIVDSVCSLYPDADRDVAIIGAFLHDMGKVLELDARRLEYTIQGGLIGHIAIGYKMLSQKISTIENFPEELSQRLEHIILSHHGEYDQQSPVLPKTLEATIVYQTDELVSQANAVKEILNAQKGDGKIWSNYVGIKNRKYFVRDQDEEGWASGKDPVDADLFH